MPFDAYRILRSIVEVHYLASRQAPQKTAGKLRAQAGGMALPLQLPTQPGFQSAPQLGQANVIADSLVHLAWGVGCLLDIDSVVYAVDRVNYIVILLYSLNQGFHFTSKILLCVIS